MTAGPPLPSAGEDELIAALAHLEALEERTVQQQVDDSEEDDVEVLMSQAVWPPGIPEPPPLDHTGDTLAAYITWLDSACAVLAARAGRNRDERARLVSQWRHLARDLGRFRPEEVTAVVEGQARARERLAADEALYLCLRVERERLVALETQRREG